jgi:hypothetical protein
MKKGNVHKIDLLFFPTFYLHFKPTFELQPRLEGPLAHNKIPNLIKELICTSR